jgi:hypothetical protein
LLRRVLTHRGAAYFLLVAAELQSKNFSLKKAKVVAEQFKQYGKFSLSAITIQEAAVRNDKQFFIDLGKCLSGEIKNTVLFDKRDLDIAEMALFATSGRDAVRELEWRGHDDMTEDNFRMWKMRLFKPSRFLMR